MQYAGIYFDTIQKLLGRIWDSQKEAMEKAVNVMTTCAEQGGLIHVFGCGHTQILVEEVWFRAGQPSFISPIFDQGLWPHNAPHKGSALEKLEGYGKLIFENHDAKPGEVIIILSNSGRNAAPVEVALEAKKRGLTVVAITSMDYSTRVKSRHSSGKRLFEIADIVIDNAGPEGDAVVQIPGLKQKAGPCTTITNAAILDAMLVQVVANLVARKGSAPVFVSANLDVPGDVNEDYIAPYLLRIHHYKG